MCFKRAAAVVALWFGLVAFAAPAGAVVVNASGTQSPRVVHPSEHDVALFRLDLANQSLLADTLRSLTFTNETLGAGAQPELDLELGALRLCRDNGNGVYEPGLDAVITTSAASSGQVRYTGLHQTIGGLDNATFFLVADLSTLAHDGDRLDVSIAAASDIQLAMALIVNGTFPISPFGDFTVDGMSAAQIGLHALAAGPITAGTDHNLVFDVTVPANGYAPDVLERVEVVNNGTAQSGVDISRLELFADDGDGAFESTADHKLGAMAFVGGGWLITGMSEPIPTSGLRLFVSADLALFASSARTIHLALPTSPADGLVVSSANDGPVDQPVVQPNDLTISTADRITLDAVPVGPATARPGTAGAMVLHLTAKNDYDTVRSIVHLRVTNATRGTGTITDLDREYQRITLRLDGNGDGSLGTLAEDPQVATGLFTGGRANLDGFDWMLAPGTTQHAFVTADLSTGNAADGDSLSVVLTGPLDVGFQQPSTPAALWPLDSGSRVTVDGLVAAQLFSPSASPKTVGSGDGPVRALELLVPANGYRPDVLSGLRVVNLGTAGTADVAEVRLWRDGGDAVFAGGGDDRDLGALAWDGAGWTSGALSETLAPAIPTRLWISATVAASPADSVTIQLGVPIGGVAVASENDGPLDATVGGSATVLVSNAPLLGSLELDRVESVVGEPVTLHMIVRNRSAETVTGIAPATLAMQGPGSFTVQSGPVPASLDLAPASVDSFVWVLDAASPGLVRVSAAAGGIGQSSGLVRAALNASSDAHHIDEPATSVQVTPTSSMPVAVTRGQHDVTPFSLTFTNPGGIDGAPVRVDRLRVRVEDSDGADLVPASVLAGLFIQSGPDVLARHDSLETSGSNMNVPLQSPQLVSPGSSVTLTVRVDISGTTTAPNFRLVILADSAIAASEAPTNRSLPVQLQSGTFPIRTGPARIVAPASELRIASIPTSPRRASQGQSGVPLVALSCLNPGITGVTSDVRLLSFAMRLRDTTGIVVGRLADLLTRVTVRSSTQTLAVRTVYPVDDSTLVVALTPALSVPPNAPTELDVSGDLTGAAPTGVVVAFVADSASVDARDVNTGDDVPVVLSVPVEGATVRVEARTESLRAHGVPEFGPRTRIGDIAVRAFSLRLRHPGASAVGRIRIDSLIVVSRDAQRHDVAPASVVARFAVRWQGTEIASLSGLPGSGGRTIIALPGPTLEAGDTAVVELTADIAANAPAGLIELSVPAAGVIATDANLGTSVALVAEDGEEFPFGSGLTQLDPPARELRAEFVSGMPVALAADGREVSAGTLRLRSTAAPGTDTIAVDRLVVRGATRGWSPLGIGTGTVDVTGWVGGAMWATSGPLSPDSTTATLVPSNPLRIPPGSTLDMEVRFHTVTSNPPGDLRLGLDSVGVVVRQPASALLQIEVRPEPGVSFPFWSSAGAFGEQNLASSVSNYPNPFAAGRELTQFVYYLSSDARVTVRLVTLQGDLVRVALDRAPRTAGMHDDDSWDGRNGVGSVVRNGVYLAEVVAEYAGGRRDRVLRKVAVAR